MTLYPKWKLLQTTDAERIALKVLNQGIGDKEFVPYHIKGPSICDLRSIINSFIQIQSELRPTPIVTLNRNPEQAIVIFGDTHGSLRDVVTGLRRSSNMLIDCEQIIIIIKGDMVDRGPHGVWVCVIFMALTILHPASVIILRGNHETYDICLIYGFRRELTKLYPDDHIVLFKEFNNMFNYLSGGLRVCDMSTKKSFFCCHGGLDETALDNDPIARFNEYSMETPNNGLLWSDPGDIDTVGCTPSVRGRGCMYGPDIVREFLTKINCECMIRAHECVVAGYSWVFNNRVCTIFTVANYYNNAVGNCAAIAIVKNKVPFVDYSSILMVPWNAEERIQFPVEEEVPQLKIDPCFDISSIPVIPPAPVIKNFSFSLQPKSPRVGVSKSIIMSLPKNTDPVEE